MSNPKISTERIAEVVRVQREAKAAAQRHQAQVAMDMIARNTVKIKG